MTSIYTKIQGLVYFSCLRIFSILPIVNKLYLENVDHLNQTEPSKVLHKFELYSSEIITLKTVNMSVK